VQRAWGLAHKIAISNGVIAPIKINGGIYMKFRLFYNKKPKLSVNDIGNFSDSEYVCYFLLQTMRGKPVAISQSTNPALGVWRVQHGFSCIYFRTYAEAMEYCRERFCDLSGKRLKDRGRK
jgi:hypothetical protein